MTSQEFRRMALSFPEVFEGAHMGHADFRVRGKIFATLGYPDKNWGIVKLALGEQQRYVQAEPSVFVPVKGAWGRQGNTNVRLKVATRTILRPALEAAWSHVAAIARKKKRHSSPEVVKT